MIAGVFFVDITALSIWGPYALRRSVNKFSSSALGKINKFLLRSFIRQFAGSSSVKFLFLLCARQNKQVSFTLAYASVSAHVEMMGFLGIGQVMCK